MRQKVVSKTLLLLLVGAACNVAASEWSAVLPPDQANAMLKQCSRGTPSGVDGAWQVPQAVIDKLEKDLPKLSKLMPQQCCVKDARLETPGAYYRQYVGVTIRGKKYVYINAFRGSPSNADARDKDAWKRKPVQVCDGGESFWGALYDPESGEFSQLAFNGVG